MKTFDEGGASKHLFYGIQTQGGADSSKALCFQHDYSMNTTSFSGIFLNGLNHNSPNNTIVPNLGSSTQFNDTTEKTNY